MKVSTIGIIASSRQLVEPEVQLQLTIPVDDSAGAINHVIQLRFTSNAVNASIDWGSGIIDELNSANDGSDYNFEREIQCTEIKVSFEDGAVLKRFYCNHNNATAAPDISAFTQLETIDIEVNTISNFDLSANTMLNEILLIQNLMPASVISQIMEDIDAFGTNDGLLDVADQTPNVTYSDLTVAGKAAHDNLISRGWSILILP